MQGHNDPAGFGAFVAIQIFCCLQVGFCLVKGRMRPSSFSNSIA